MNGWNPEAPLTSVPLAYHGSKSALPLTSAATLAARLLPHQLRSATIDGADWLSRPKPVLLPRSLSSSGAIAPAVASIQIPSPEPPETKEFETPFTLAPEPVSMPV